MLLRAGVPPKSQDWAREVMHGWGSPACPPRRWWAEGVWTTPGLGAPCLRGQGSTGLLMSPHGHPAQPPSLPARVALGLGAERRRLGKDGAWPEGPPGTGFPARVGALLPAAPGPALPGRSRIWHLA